MSKNNWVYSSTRNPKKWSIVECVYEKNQYCSNALYQFSGRFIDISTDPLIDASGTIWRDTLFGVLKWRYIIKK